MTPRRAFLGLLLLALMLPVSSRAEKDWFASLYTSEGIELRADERVFALYALLNAMGYDEAPVVRHFPVPSRAMHPVRLELRKALSIDPALAKKVDAFFTAHPEPAEAYARYALTLKAPAGFETTSDSPAGLKGFEELLAEAYGSMKLGDVFGRVQGEYRSTLKRYHPVIDAPVAEVRRLLKMKEDEPPRVVLILNLLDGQGKSVSRMVGEELFVVVGPSAEPDLYALVLEVARAKLAGIVGPKAAASKVLPDIAAAAHAESAAAFATEVYARAFAAAALKLAPEKLEPLTAAGYHAVGDLAGLVPAFSSSEAALDAFVNENLWLLAKEAPAKPAAPTTAKAN